MKILKYSLITPNFMLKIMFILFNGINSINPLYTNGVFLLVWYNTPGLVHCTYLGVSGYNFQKNILYFVWRSFYTNTNRVDPDEMQHDAAFHLGLYCL